MARVPITGQFSRRQLEIVGLIANGASDKEIAAKLGISIPTVRTHLQRLYRDRGLHSRAEAVALLLANSVLGAGMSLVDNASLEMMSSVSMTTT